MNVKVKVKLKVKVENLTGPRLFVGELQGNMLPFTDCGVDGYWNLGVYAAVTERQESDQFPLVPQSQGCVAYHARRGRRILQNV